MMPPTKQPLCLYSSVFNLLLFVAPSELDLSLCPPPPSYKLLLTKGNYFIASLLIYILDYNYITFVYNIVLILKILFWCNAL